MAAFPNKEAPGAIEPLPPPKSPPEVAGAVDPNPLAPTPPLPPPRTSLLPVVAVAVAAVVVVVNSCYRRDHSPRPRPRHPTHRRWVLLDQRPPPGPLVVLVDQTRYPPLVVAGQKAPGGPRYPRTTPPTWPACPPRAAPPRIRHWYPSRTPPPHPFRVATGVRPAQRSH